MKGKKKQPGRWCLEWFVFFFCDNNWIPLGNLPRYYSPQTPISAEMGWPLPVFPVAWVVGIDKCIRRAILQASSRLLDLWQWVSDTFFNGEALVGSRHPLCKGNEARTGQAYWGGGAQAWARPEWDLEGETENPSWGDVIPRAASNHYFPLSFPPQTHLPVHSCQALLSDTQRLPFTAWNSGHWVSPSHNLMLLPGKPNLSSPFGSLRIHDKRSSLVWCCSSTHFLSPSSLSLC